MVNNSLESRDFPIDRKYTISLTEASLYYGIGEKKLRDVVTEHQDESFVIRVGRKFLIKREKFQTWLDGVTTL